MKKYIISAAILLLAGCNIPNEYKPREEKKNAVRENLSALMAEMSGWTVADTTITMSEADMRGLAKEGEKFYEWTLNATIVKGSDTLHVTADDYDEVIDSTGSFVPGNSASITYKEFADDYPAAEKERINLFMQRTFGNRKHFSLDKDLYDVVTVKFSKPKRQQ